MASSCRSLDKVMNCNDLAHLSFIVLHCKMYIYRFIRNVRCRISRKHDALPKSRVLAAEEMNNARDLRNSRNFRVLPPVVHQIR